MSRFRVALSLDVRHKGKAVFDLSPLTANPAIEIGFVEPENGIIPASVLADHDALILLFPSFSRASIPADHRLALIAKVGVGYDNVDVPACTEAGIALVTAPDGVRRPVAVATITFLLALSGRLFVKDKLARHGPKGFDQRLDHNGIGLVGSDRSASATSEQRFSASPSRSTCISSRTIPTSIRRLLRTRDQARRSGYGLSRVGFRYRQSRSDAGDAASGRCQAARSDEAGGLSDQLRARPSDRPASPDQSPAGTPDCRCRPGRLRP